MVTLEGDWDAWMKVVDPARFGRAIEVEMRRATMDNCMYLIARIKRAVNDRRYAPNAALTILLKSTSAGKGDLPLVDQNDMMKYLAYDLINSYEALVGVKKSAGGVNIAEVLHEGATIRMTRAMKRWIAIAISKATKGKGAPAAFGSSPAAINIPGRPFLNKVIQNKTVQARVRRRWMKAYELALVGSAKTA